jgi:hypothetical protein
MAHRVATIAKTIETSAEVSLKVHQRWTPEEELLARNAFRGAFGQVPAFGGGFDEPAALARDRRAFENAAIEAALDYREVISGMDTAASDHDAGKITIEEFIGRSTRAHTDSISRRIEADIARNAATFRVFVITAAVLLVICWIGVLMTGTAVLLGGVVSLFILVGCTVGFFTFNPYDHR